MATTTMTYNGEGRVGTQQFVDGFSDADNDMVEAGSMQYAHFDGEYFGSKGMAHYLVPDFQGNTAMDLDARGVLVEETHYYPYGEPWSQPQGQPWLFGGKERECRHRLGDSNFGARTYTAARATFAQPDPLYGKYPDLSPWSHCAANPVTIVDPSGSILQLSGDDIKGAMSLINEGVSGLTTSISEDGIVSYALDENTKLNKFARYLMDIVNDQTITVSVLALKSTELPNGFRFAAGAYLGNNYDAENGTVETMQAICPAQLKKMSDIAGIPGQDIFHELTESYIGGQLALQLKQSSPHAEINSSNYDFVHAKASPQTDIYQEVSLATPIFSEGHCYTRYKRTWYVVDSNNKKIIITEGFFYKKVMKKYLYIIFIGLILSSCQTAKIENMKRITDVFVNTPVVVQVKIKKIITNGEKWIYLAESDGREFYIKPANNKTIENEIDYRFLIKSSKNYLVALVPPPDILMFGRRSYEWIKTGKMMPDIYTAYNMYDQYIYPISEKNFIIENLTEDKLKVVD